MAKPAARLSDKDACPKTGHGVNPTVTGSPNVLINGLPALRVGDSSACGDSVTQGISNILVNGQPIAFLGSATAHGGVIITGSGDVVVGTQHTPAPFVAPLPLANMFNCQLQLCAANGQPYSNLPYQVTLADGSVQKGITDALGATLAITTAVKTALTSIQILPPSFPTVCCARGAPAQSSGVTIALNGVQTASANGQINNLTAVKKDDTSRPLTSGELAMAQSIFKDSIDYSTVKVHREEYLPFGLQPDDTAMTPNGEMYFNPQYYKEDFSLSSTPDDLPNNHWFMHEMVHVWQYQLGYWVKLHGMLLHPGRLWGLLGNPYEYSLTPTSKLQDFNMEQQGDIIADYYAWVTGNPVRSNSGRSIKSVTPYLSVLADFLRNPNDKNLLP
jgi:uncharacterized Zn-binding protein involved in type VI secretion